MQACSRGCMQAGAAGCSRSKSVSPCCLRYRMEDMLCAVGLCCDGASPSQTDARCQFLTYRIGGSSRAASPWSIGSVTRGRVIITSCFLPTCEYISTIQENRMYTYHSSQHSLMPHIEYHALGMIYAPSRDEMTCRDAHFTPPQLSSVHVLQLQPRKRLAVCRALRAIDDPSTTVGAACLQTSRLVRKWLARETR